VYQVADHYDSLANEVYSPTVHLTTHTHTHTHTHTKHTHIWQVADHYDSLTKEQVLEVVRKAMGHCLDNLSVAAGTSGPKPPSEPLL
jgi:galactose-1-phosphate uridylyltransferase